MNLPDSMAEWENSETSVRQIPDGRSPLSLGMEWGTRVTAIGLEFALPALLGFGLDRWWHTAPWMTVGGAILGVGMGMLHVIRLASEPQGSPRRGQSKSGGSAGDGDPSA